MEEREEQLSEEHVEERIEEDLVEERMSDDDAHADVYEPQIESHHEGDSFGGQEFDDTQLIAATTGLPAPDEGDLNNNMADMMASMGVDNLGDLSQEPSSYNPKAEPFSIREPVIHESPQFDESTINNIDFTTHVPIGPSEEQLTESTDIDITRLSVGERLYYIGCGMQRNRQERLRRERENQIVAELSAVTAKPMITNRARQLPAKGSEFAEHNTLWSKRLEKERRKHEAKKHMDDIAETLQKVEMNPKSAAMIERGRLKAKYRGPISGWNKHFAKFQTKKNIIPEREVFSPNINVTSANLQRDGGVGERLYEEASRKEERLRTMVNMASLRELVDPVTDQPYFKPHTPHAGAATSCQRRSRSRDVDSVVHSLLSRGQETQKKKERAASQDHSQKYSFKPRLNARSREMVTAKGKKPLYDREKFSRKSKRQAANILSQPVSPGDKVEDKGIRVDSSGVPTYCTQAFIRRNERLVLHRQERVNAIKREMEEKELQHCTFTPRICRQSTDILTNGQAISTGAAYSTKSMERRRPHNPSGIASPQPVSALHSQQHMAHEPGSPEAVDADVGTVVVSSFEKEMMNVLEEWRKLEDV
eukprot:TRINITY_DN2462_c0_g1_i1.p1 TRINITY_DN2462_c0_g1~~TRINITY_DN2462_c0_g1_i1.p1  ORF type:complete len:593 (+),score=143.41 TRINITY_DN2462_c0_g1_i1:49-1827(+)